MIFFFSPPMRWITQTLYASAAAPAPLSTVRTHCGPPVQKFSPRWSSDSPHAGPWLQGTGAIKTKRFCRIPNSAGCFGFSWQPDAIEEKPHKNRRGSSRILVTALRPQGQVVTPMWFVRSACVFFALSKLFVLVDDFFFFFFSECKSRQMGSSPTWVQRQLVIVWGSEPAANLFILGRAVAEGFYSKKFN